MRCRQVATQPELKRERALKHMEMGGGEAPDLPTVVPTVPDDECCHP
jgi:hypothetical protein